MGVTPLDWRQFDVTKERGFLPPRNPYHRLMNNKMWEDTASELPQLLAARQLGPRVHTLPRFTLDKLYGDELWRAHVVLSFIFNGYVWELHQDRIARNSVPANLAVPYVQISRLIGMPPILSYASYALNNWRLINNREPIELDNIALLNYFWGGLDEAWFTLVHVEIEAQAGRALVGAVRGQENSLEQKYLDLEVHLNEILSSLQRINRAFNRMPERCDPYIYYNRVRPWIWGWKMSPGQEHMTLLPNGLVYEDVEEFGGKPQKFRGETGAQSSIAPLLDAALGVRHEQNVLSDHLAEMRDYMPPKHRELIAAVEARPAMRNFVLQHKSLHGIWNACIDEFHTFRKTHFGYASGYIAKQERKNDGPGNTTVVGTGGTSFMESLKKHMEETLEAKV